jgi:hypothetical protein
MFTLKVASVFDPAAPPEGTCQFTPMASPDGGLRNVLAFVCPDEPRSGGGYRCRR